MKRTGISRFLLRQAGKLALLLAASCVITFILVSHSPIDPTQAYIGADLLRVGAEQRDAIAEYWGLNDPPLQRFFFWFGSLLQGDFGTSMIHRAPVSEVIADRFLSSLVLMITAWVMSGILGFTAGVTAAMKRGSWLDRAIQWYCYTLSSTPTFWAGLLLLIVFTVWLPIFPVGLGTPAGVLAEDVTWLDRVRHMILPALTLSITGLANIALHTRAKLIDVLGSDYVLFARAKGEEGFVLFRRHGLRNILLPAITLQFASFSELFGGAVLVEQIFSYPGLGRATVEASTRGDVPLLLGIVLFSTLFVFTGNLLSELIYRWIDPRIREGQSI
ncbi:peptide/nickel transport system permease protein [Paenibacillus phyllosphaerae]|uniref:Peptide/nickel transport system permease protein n=1 Tax=Paenibacillus phyllosphaerae TaxID=274593 RepID=A0A7W5B275_9BACL|nr:ABC transporter permease [Paenibacillus phyllosphaerae]MBB3112809.1 peptide/nickel transport system permease protein [Paenibacillus phyllosphaerae]